MIGRIVRAVARVLGRDALHREIRHLRDELGELRRSNIEHLSVRSQLGEALREATLERVHWKNEYAAQARVTSDLRRELAEALNPAASVFARDERDGAPRPPMPVVGTVIGTMILPPPETPR